MAARRRPQSSSVAALSLGALVAVAAACARPAESPAGAAAAVSGAPVKPSAAEEVDDTTVTLEPTRAGELPAAILGRAPAPQGASIKYFAGDTAARGYLALPRGAGRHPAVILVHEWNGLGDRVKQVADAMAAEGYVALAVDLFSGKTGSTPAENRALIAATMTDPQRVIANIDAAAKFLRARPDVSGKIATMGWCFGGGIALSYGIEGEHHEGTAMFYGRLVTDPAELAKMRHPVYGTFAAKDDGIPPAQVQQFVEALRSAGIQNDVHIYDDMEHGFWLWVDQDPGARTKPALDAWERLKTYLQGALG